MIRICVQLCIALCLVLPTLAVPPAIYDGYDTAFQTIWYYSLTDGGVTIMGAEPLYRPTIGAMVIPGTLNGHTVVGICERAFYNRSELRSVVVPEGVTKIGDSSFEGCSGLTFAVLPSSLTSIGYRAFFNCSGLSAQTIPSGVETIRASTFQGCTGLLSVTMEDGVKTIGDYAFYNCSKLRDLVIPQSVSKIGVAAFKGCPALSSVTIPKCVTVLSEVFPDACYKIKKVDLCAGTEKIENRAFYCGGVEIVTIPNGVASIGDDAFFCCRNLSSIAIPSGVTSIGHGAFMGSGLTSLSIPSSVKNIGDYAFADSHGLSSVTLPSGLASVGAYVFRNCGLTTVSIPAGVTGIGEGTFANCEKLTAVSIPSSVKSIGFHAFIGCEKLTYVLVDKDDEERVRGLFAAARCPADDYVFIDDGSAVSTVKYSVLYLPGADGQGDGKTVQKTRGVALRLEGETFTRTGYVQAGWSVVDGGEKSYDLCASYISNASISLYPYWTKVPTVPEFAIVDGVLRSYSGKGGDVVIPAGVTSIGDSAFSGCNEITSLIVPKGVTSIGAYAFYGCSGLVSVSLPDGLLSIGDNAFRGCSDLASVSLPESLTSIGVCAFWSCSKLDGVVLPTKVTRIESGMFAGCSGLASVGIPAGVAAIGENAFTECSSLMSIQLPENLTKIEYGAFYGCSGLTALNIPRQVASVGFEAFKGCDGLTRVAIPSCVVSLSGTFGSAYTSIEEVIIDEGVAEIAEREFAWCGGLRCLTIPSSVKSVGNGAFTRCDSLKTIVVARGDVDRVRMLLLSAGCPVDDYVFEENAALAPPSSCAVIYLPGAYGVGAMVIDEKVDDVDLKLRDALYVRDGFTQTGWSLSDGGEMAYGLGAVYKNNTGLSLYPCWLQDHKFVIESGTLKSYSGPGGDLVVPSEVTSIASSAFQGCTTLTSVTIPSSVTSIGDFAFDVCSGLTSVTIPSSVTSIGWNAFLGCSGLESFVVDSANQNYSSPNGLLCSGDGKTIIAGVNGKVMIPSSVTSIGVNAFSRRSGLESVIIPEGVVQIDGSAFASCSGLTSVALPKSVTSIGSYVFYGCSELESMVIHSGVLSIGSQAFDGCESLITVNVDKGDAQRVKGLYDWADTVQFIEIVQPVIEGDEGATVTGDAESGYVIKPSEGKTAVVVTIPQGVDAAKVTVEVSPNVKSVKPNGAIVKVVNGSADITQFLYIPGTEQNEAGGVVAAQNDAVIDLTKAAVKGEVVREVLDPAKGAVVKLDPTNPVLATANTRIGLIYTFREGRTLAGMKKSGDGHLGDGDPWMPEIKVKGGDSAFYSIGVGMTDEPDSEAGETLPYDDALYCVIDLSGGTSATKYPVSVLDDVPSGGWTEEYKTTKLVLRRIEPGSYLIQNQYEIVLTKPFYIGVFEVTQKQYELVMGSNPSSYKGDTRPVECVTYDSIRGTDLGTHWPTDNGVDTQSFLGRLRNKTGLDFDLPTEAEWEYACRAGTTSVYNNGGSSLRDLKQVARCYYNCNDGKGGYSVAHTTVGSYLVNAWGLYDMHGNVWEWCRDWEGSLAAGTDPKGAATSSAGAGRVHRGGCWYGDSNGCTATIRGGGDPSSGDYYKGFRISRTLR